MAVIEQVLKWFFYPRCRGCRRKSCYVNIDQDGGYVCLRYMNLS